MPENVSDISIEGIGVGDLDLGGGDSNAGKNPPPVGTNTTNVDAEKVKAEEAKKALEVKTALIEEAKKLGLPETATDVEIAAAKKALEGNNTLPEAVEIDGVKYKLDKDGNALDDKGTIVKTKAELDAIEASDLPPLIEELIQKTGVVIKDDKGVTKKYDDTIEGMIQYNKDVAELNAIESYRKLIESDPEIKDFYEFKRRGGTKEEYFHRLNNSWSQVKLDENNEQQLEDVVIADMIAAGISEEQAKQTAALYKDSKRLKEFGKAAYTRLVTNEAEIKKEEEEIFKNELVQRETNLKKYYDDVKTTITKGVLNNVVIPEADKEKFFNYLAIPVDDKRNSQKTIDKGKLSIEQSLQLDYFLFKGFNLSDLIANAVKTTNATSLRNRVKSYQTTNTGNKSANNGKPINANDTGITIDNLY